MFSSGYRKFFVLLFLFAVALVGGSYVRSRWPLSSSSDPSIAGAWSVEKSGSGLAVSWNFRAPLFQGAQTAVLEIEDGGERRSITLKREDQARTLFYTPRQLDVTLRLRIPQAGTGQPEKTEIIRIGMPEQAAVVKPAAPVQPAPEETRRSADVPDRPPAGKASRPVAAEGSRSRTIAPVSVWRVRAFAPPSLTSHLKANGMDVAVYVKIAPSGKVTAASTRKYGSATEAALAKIATNAAMQWKFDHLKDSGRGNPIYRDFVIHFKFPKT
ncbi:MAG: hypothetical protein ABJF23_32970 [Bryobacteraceae bacterium]